MDHDDDADDGMCKACGGRVDAQGMAKGGEMEGSDFAEPGVNLEGDTTQDIQADAEEKAARRSFVKAVKMRGIRT